MHAEGRHDGIGGQVGELRGSAFEKLQGGFVAIPLEEGLGEGRRGPRGAKAVTQLAADLHGASDEMLGLVIARGGARRLARPFEQVRLLGRVGRDAQCLLQERDGLVVRAQARGPIGGGLECDPRLARECIGLGALRGIRMRSEVVAGQGSGELIGFERLEESRCGEVTRLPLRPRKGRVGNLADQRLHEEVLPALGRSRVELPRQQLSPDEGREARFQRGLLDARDHGQGGQAERLAEHSRVVDDRPLRCVERVEPRGDERSQRLRERTARPGPRPGRNASPSSLRRPSATSMRTVSTA